MFRVFKYHSTRHYSDTDKGKQCRVYVSRWRPKKARKYKYLSNLLSDRWSHDWRDYRKHLLPKIRKKFNIPADVKISWSQYAGCSMCPCSPGFIVQSDPRVSDLIGQSIWVTVKPTEISK